MKTARFSIGADSTSRAMAMWLVLGTLLVAVALYLGGCGPAQEERAQAYKQYCELGDTYLEQGRWDEAVSEYSEAIQLDTDNAIAYSGRAVAYREKGDYELALADSETARELAPLIPLDARLAEVFKWSGDQYLYYQNDKYDEAIAAYSLAIELNSENAAAYADRALAYGQKDGYYELAILDYEKALELDPSVQLDSLLAQSYIKRGEYNAHSIDGGCDWDKEREQDEADLEKAVADYTRAIELDPSLAEAYEGRADCYIDFVECREDFIWTGWGEEHYDKAIADYSRAIALDPTNATYYKSRAWAYHVGEDYSHELLDMHRVIELDPTNAGYYRSRGLTYMREKQNYGMAIADFSKAIELDPNDFFLYDYRGDAHMARGDHDQAIDDYTQAIEIVLTVDPDSWSVASFYDDRGDAHMEQGSYDLAIDDYTTAMEQSSWPSSTYYNNRAAAYLALHNYELAIADSTAAIEQYSNSDEAYWIRGQAYAALGKTDEALADYQECLALTERIEQYYTTTRERNDQIRDWVVELQSG